MTKSKRDKLSRAARRAKVADLYLKCFSQRQIALELGISQATVCRDLLAVQDEWVKSAMLDFDKRKAMELAKIDRVEREAWLAYERKIGPKQRKKMSVKAGNKDGEVVMWEEAGDPRFLRIVLDCIDRRSALLGLDAPKKVGLSILDGIPPAEYTDEELKILTTNPSAEQIEQIYAAHTPRQTAYSHRR